MNLTPDQLASAKSLAQALNEVKLTNNFLRAGILAVVYKESGLKPRVETSYSTTAAARIRAIFGSWFQGWSDAQIDALKRDDRAFFNRVYSFNKRLGNLGGDDGYNFRGRGYNQLTGRANYEAIGKRIGVNLIASPDMLLQADIAAKACAVFFYDCIVSAQASGVFKARHKITRTGELTDVYHGALLAHDVNGGFGIWPEQDPTGGFNTTRATAQAMYDLIVSSGL